ncbi:ferric reductase-like transmembrane domain-containing protein [Kitasatospora sp. NPDC088391]|uniref:ferredoxin reductase family protein n=1 Tax=Kitasatospora sp. NPDC088391 TaxID=3364074 RepID=UPI00381DA7C8
MTVPGDLPSPAPPVHPPATRPPVRPTPTRLSAARHRARAGAGTVPRLSPQALLLGIRAGGAATAACWAVGAVPSARLAAVLATGAHLAGLLADYGMLVMLLLMARVPAIEHGVGADVLARWHARGGRYVLALVGAHVLLAAAGFAAFSGRDLVASVRALLAFPALAAAALGTALLALVGAVSARAVRRRVRHETWRAVHLLTYLAASLVFAHEAAGPDLADPPFFALLWSLLHAQVAVLLLWYRCAVPLRQVLRHRLRVVRVEIEGPDVVSVLIAGERLDELRAEAGQFFRWRFLTRRLWSTALPFSLSAAPQAGALRITVKALGDHTRRVRRLRPGVRVVATGPFGSMTAHRRTRRKVLLLAGGVGITPMRALFETLPGGPGDLALLYRAGSADHLVLRRELEEIAARRQAELHYLLGSSDGEYNPLAPALLLRLLPDLTERDVFLCGPPGMTAAAVEALGRAGVPPRRVHCETFAF